MKTKIIIGGLLAALMLVIVPVITVSVTGTIEEETTLEKTTQLEDIPEEVISVKDTTVKVTINEEKTTEHTEYFRFGFISANFLEVIDSDIDFDNGLLFVKNIIVNSPGKALTKSLKINGKTIVESGTPVKLEINLMGNLGFRLHLTSIIGWSQGFHLRLSGFAMGIKVTY